MAEASRSTIATPDGAARSTGGPPPGGDPATPAVRPEGPSILPGGAVRLIGRPRRRAPHLAALIGVGCILTDRAPGAPDATVAWVDPGRRVRRLDRPDHGAVSFAATEGLLVSAGADPVAPTLSAAIAPLREAAPASAFHPEGEAFADALAEHLAAWTDAATVRPALAAIREARLSHQCPVPLPPGAAGQLPDRARLVLLPDAACPDPVRLGVILDAALATVAAGEIALLAAPADRRLAAPIARALKAGIAVADPRTLPLVLAGAGEAVWVDRAADGFFALLAGRPVRTFGAPFYAGRGQTRDTPLAVADAARLSARAPAPLETVAAAVLLGLSRYADPVSRTPVDLMAAVERLVDWRGRLEGRARPRVWARPSSWKRPVVEAFFGGTGEALVFDHRRPVERAAAIGGEILYWGNRKGAALREAARRHPARPAVLQVEDGFVRSVGLGADLARPASWAVDDLGMYYDATRPSRLETILQTEDFDPATLARAARLRRTLVERGVSKYNVAASPFARPPSDGRPVALVVGQVPDDRSVIDGLSPFAGDALAFLEAVRAARPDAFLLYKEHPDLARGFRPGRLEPRELAGLADRAVEGGDITAVLRAVDEVHVMTSLAGFEALLHGKPVTAWGLPFYAGWGLTTDMVATPRRTRRRTVDELVAAALVRYPTYLEPLSGVPCEVEDVVASILAARDEPGAAGAWRLSSPLARLVRAGSRFKTAVLQPLAVRRRSRARRRRR